jgi:prepilin-type N-terminal cleavage/methylation domain-containing protein/prepilin-type processing-associated H-X9-DG protein
MDGLHRRRRSGFTLVELLVVIAIIAVLISVLLPAIANARDRTRTVLCMHQQKEIFMVSTAFQGDFNAIMPAWYYALRPEGPYPGEDPGLGHPIFGWSYNHFGHMLIDYGYISRAHRITPSGSAAQQFIQLAGLAKASPFVCPNAFIPMDAAHDNPADFLTGPAEADPKALDRDRCRLARLWGSSNSPGGNGTYYSSYNINMNAGSFVWYHDASVNYGMYPRRVWTKTSPDKIGYLFESGEFGVDENHLPTAYSLLNNSWGVGSWGQNYCPVRPHNNYVESNLLYYDGHIGVLAGDYTSTAFPFSWY